MQSGTTSISRKTKATRTIPAPFTSKKTKRHWYYAIEKAIIMKDGAGNEIGRIGFQKDSGDGYGQIEGDGNPSKWETKLPDKLAISSEAQGNPRNYIQFTIGAQNWKTSDPNEGMPRCNVGEWSSQWSPTVGLLTPSIPVWECKLMIVWSRNVIWIVFLNVRNDRSGWSSLLKEMFRGYVRVDGSDSVLCFSFFLITESHASVGAAPPKGRHPHSRI